MLSGKAIFRLMDTQGLPLSVINEILRTKQMCFNVVEFVEAALASKNFSYKTIKNRLLEAMLSEKREEFAIELDSRFAKEVNDGISKGKKSSLLHAG